MKRGRRRDAFVHARNPVARRQAHLVLGLSARVFQEGAPCVFHPLSSIPGPWYAAVWITSHVLRLEKCNTIHALFRTYGREHAPTKSSFAISAR
ncbi:hypothetical protein B0H16DRAFT_1563106 [Mycena metata]|uniref:Uncharacterized protein n=1 Tax=Mycena metata TaxID=1033252 RepID=A0AAD7IHV9_9AGAR|nr:hypothetical protein B0H16DRAFT_1563106 [Mycena metata]